MSAGRDKGDDHMATFTVNGQSVTVEKTVMLTGDRSKVADHVAQSLGVDEVHSELLRCV